MWRNERCAIANMLYVYCAAGEYDTTYASVLQACSGVTTTAELIHAAERVGMSLQHKRGGPRALLLNASSLPMLVVLNSTSDSNGVALLYSCNDTHAGLINGLGAFEDVAFDDFVRRWTGDALVATRRARWSDEVWCGTLLALPTCAVVLLRAIWRRFTRSKKGVRLTRS